MKQASTREFRATVRAVAAKNGLWVTSSWTNGPGTPLGSKGKRLAGPRIVNMMVHTGNAAKFVKQVTKALEQQGLEADVRASFPGETMPQDSAYIKGNCTYIPK